MIELGSRTWKRVREYAAARVSELTADLISETNEHTELKDAVRRTLIREINQLLEILESEASK